MNLFLCEVCDYETPDKENLNNHSFSNDHKEKVKYYEFQEKNHKNNDITNEKRLDILLDMNYIKKKIKDPNEFNDYDNIRYLQKYHEYNYYKKYYNKSFKKMKDIIDGICLYKL